MDFSNKGFQRLLLIGNGVVFQLVNAMSTAIVAYAVMSKQQEILWGKFAAMWLLITWLSVVFNFGSKDFLLKKYSHEPMQLLASTQQFMVLRLPIFLLCIILVFLMYDITSASLITGILVSSYIINSFNPLMVFEKRFSWLMFVEILAITTQLLFIFFKGGNLSVPVLLLSFLWYHLIKLTAFLMYYGKGLLPKFQKIDFSDYQLLWPFFLLTVGGMLINKSDFIVVTYLLEDIQKAHYQVISTFISMGVIAAHAILQPFVKQVYRINVDAFETLSRKYFGIGVFLSFLYVVTVVIACNFIFNIQLSTNSLILLYGIELLFFAMNPIVFFLFRNDKQQHFVYIVISSGTSALLMALILVKMFQLEGALLANLFGNMMMLFLLWRAKRKINNIETA